MKSLVRVLVILGLGTIITSYFFHEPPRRFYYAFEEKIYLEEVGDKVIVQLSDENTLSQESVFSDFPSLKDKEFSLRGENTFILGADIGEALSLFGEHGEVVKVNCIYKTPEGSELGFTDRFIVELKPGFSKKGV